MLRRAVEEKDAAVAQAAEAAEGLEVQMKIAQGRLEQSEVGPYTRLIAFYHIYIYNHIYLYVLGI